MTTLSPGQKAARTRRRRNAARKAAATRKGIGTPKIPRGSYRTLKGGLGWRLYNPPGNRYIKAILIARYQSGGAKFAVFRVL